MEKPYSESCDQNREPILSVIKPLLKDKRTVLEIGSGTGQHAVYFTSKMPHLTWQPTDQKQYLHGINLWRRDAHTDSILEPLELDVTRSEWPDKQYDAIFSANTLHIMHLHDVKSFFRGVKDRLNEDGVLIIYGPFNYNYQFTSESNARFDDWLKMRDSQSGIRHFEEVNELASQQSLVLEKDYPMPANNRILYWKLESNEV